MYLQFFVSCGHLAGSEMSHLQIVYCFIWVQSNLYFHHWNLYNNCSWFCNNGNFKVWGCHLQRWKKWVWWIGSLMLTEKTRVLRKKPILLPFYPPQISDGQAWDWSWAFLMSCLGLATSNCDWNTQHRGSPRSSGLLFVWRSGKRVIDLRLFVTLLSIALSFDKKKQNLTLTITSHLVTEACWKIHNI